MTCSKIAHPHTINGTNNANGIGAVSVTLRAPTEHGGFISGMNVIRKIDTNEAHDDIITAIVNALSSLVTPTYR